MVRPAREREDVKRRFIGKFRRKEDPGKTRSRRYWLIQANPSSFSIEDLEAHPTKIVHWGADRNVEANAMLREMQEGDKAFFYHGRCDKPAIVGIVSVFRSAFPDERQFDKYDRLYDPAASSRKPVWFQVDVKFERKLSRPIPITELQLHAEKLGRFPLLSNPKIPVCELPLVSWTFVASLLLQAPHQDILPGLDEIKPEEISIPSSMADGKVGEGAYGTVLKGLCRGKDVAVKIFFKKKLDQGALAAFDHEVGIVSSKHHPNIVQFLGICHMGDRMMLVTDYMPRGNLHDMLTNHSVEMSPYLRMQMARDVVLGMNWLHSSVPQVLHRDLKTKNLLVDENNRVKICDFGLSQLKATGAAVKDPDTGAKGTPLWMAPEVLLGKAFDEKIDIYSFGLVLWQIITREKEPFIEFEKSTISTFCNAVCVKNYRPKIPTTVEPLLRKLITACWNPTPAKRPSFAQILGVMDELVVNYGIREEVGRGFWLESFQNQTRVPWKAFVQELQNLLSSLQYDDRYKAVDPAQVTEDSSSVAMLSDYQLNELSTSGVRFSKIVAEEWQRRYGEMFNYAMTEVDELLSIRCLKMLLTSKLSLEGLKKDSDGDEFVVDLDRFGNVLDWFGPIVDPASKHVLFLDRIRRTLSHEWFHGDVGQEESKTRLMPQEPGTFLVRFSSKPGSFTISTVDRPGEISHRRLSTAPDGSVVIFNKSFPSLEALLCHHKESLNLRIACPGSQYRALFQQAQSAYVLPENMPDVAAADPSAPSK